MTIVLGVVCVALALALVYVVRVLTAAQREAEAAWGGERRELLNRIQRPDRLPVQPVGEFEIPDREPDEWATVGTVDIDPEYGLDDE